MTADETGQRSARLIRRGPALRLRLAPGGGWATPTKTEVLGFVHTDGSVIGFQAVSAG
jgi:hypothetical protein